MMKVPLVSVVMPVYNVAPYVRQAVESVLEQDYTNLELILVNDGSSDGTQEILQSFSFDNRVRIISRENKGLIDSLNEGITASKGELIARMDGDDVCYKWRIAEQVALFLADPDLAICGTHVDYLLPDGSVQSIKPPILDAEQIKIASIYSVYFIHPTLMFSRRLLEEGPIYHSEYLYCEDFDLVRRTVRIHKPSFISRAGVLVRSQRDGSIRNTHARMQAQIHHKIVEENLKYYKIIESSSNLLRKCTQPSYDLRQLEPETFRNYMVKIVRGADLFPGNEPVYIDFYKGFLDHLFQTLAMNNDIAVVGRLYRRAELIKSLHPKQKLLLNLRILFPSQEALYFRDNLVRISRRWRARKMRKTA